MPIIEPEALMDGAHTQARCQQVTEVVLRSVFEQLLQQGVMLEAIILKPNMVIAGPACLAQNTTAEVADCSRGIAAPDLFASAHSVAHLSFGAPEPDS